LSALAQRLIESADIAESTRNLWTWTLTKHITPKLGDRKPGSITRGDVRDLLAGIQSRAVAKNARRLIAWIFARAVEDEIVGASPCVGLGRPPKEAPRDRVLTHAELRDLWNAAGASGAYGAAVRWLMLTAARKEEGFAATWPEIDREAKTWTIPGVRAKNRQRHVLPLSPAAIEILDGLTEHDEDKRLFRVTATSKSWRQLLERAGIIDIDVVPEPEDDEEEDDGEDLPLVRRPWTAQPIRIHDLRRTARNSLTHDLGVALAVAETVIGHTASELIRTYSPSGVVPLRDVRTALDRWASYLKVIVSGERAPKVRQMPGRV
jgi:integrase